MSSWFTIWSTVEDKFLQYFECVTPPQPPPEPEPYYRTLFYQLLEALNLNSPTPTTPTPENDLCIFGQRIKHATYRTIRDLLLISTIPLGIWIFFYTSFRIAKRLTHIWYYGGDILQKYNYKDDTILSNMQYSSSEMIYWILNRRPIEFGVVGMDCEMISTSTHVGQPKPAILQLATTDGVCTIFQLKHMEDVFILEKILCDPKILLVGVAVMNDARYLRDSYGISSNGCLDLRHMANEVGINPKGLNYLASVVLGKSLKKNKSLGPWESKDLSEKQLKYAALDARTSVDIFMKINNDLIHRRHSWFSRLFWDEKTYWDHTLELWNKFVQKPFTYPECYMESQTFNNELPTRNYSSYYRYIQLESAAYQRCCVVCGSSDEKDNIRKKAIVPFDYNIKSLKSLPHYLDLCEKCLIESWKHDRELRENLSEECGAPYPVYNDHRLKSVKEIVRKIMMTRTITDHFSQDEFKLCKELDIARSKLSLDNLKLILTMDCWPRTDHGSHVSYIYHDEFSYLGEDKLRRYWCENFLIKMQPRYLPESWKRIYS